MHASFTRRASVVGRLDLGAGAKRPPHGGGPGAAKSEIWHVQNGVRAFTYQLKGHPNVPRHR